MTTSTTSVNYSCTLGYTLQLCNQSLINLFTQVYGGIAGQNAWLQIPSNKVLIAQGNDAEVSARWNVILIGIQNSVSANCNTVCSTNLANELALHDLLLLSLLPPSYQATTCSVAQATALTSTLPTTITTVNGSTGQSSTVTVPPSNQIQPAPIQNLVPMTTPIPSSTNNASSVISAAGNNAQLQNIFNTLNYGYNGFSGTVSNQSLFNNTNIPTN
jgi:hypothetical protein